MRLVESNEPIVKSGRTGMVVCGDSELHPSAGRRLGFARTTAPQPAAGQTLRPRGNPLIGFPLAKTSHWELFAPFLILGKISSRRVPTIRKSHGLCPHPPKGHGAIGALDPWKSYLSALLPLFLRHRLPFLQRAAHIQHPLVAAAGKALFEGALGQDKPSVDQHVAEL